MPKKHSTNGHHPGHIGEPHHPHARADSPAVAPQWVRITAELRQAIATGHYGPGALLPSTAELCDAYQVSTTTARRVLGQLVMEGLAEARKGRGTVVIRPQPRRTQPVRRYNPADGPAPADIAQTVITSGLDIPPADIAALIDADPARPLFHHATALADAYGNPVELCDAYAAPDADPEPLRRSLDAGHDWPDAVRKATGRAPAYASTAITARQATPAETDALAMRATAAIVLIADTITYDHSRRALAIIRSVTPADRTRLTDYYQTPEPAR
ncbi:GntR family transcriptional regulator [Thermopolyspora sp. NPDC052614]|uniref:GntR family transcriptional regulator n=1 Tax=Thermopolyspora sp. NPDC052614 TaxID=3155682 RepID=UPI0034468A07